MLFILGMFVFWQSSDGVVSWVSSQLSIETWLQKERSEWLSFLFVMTGMMLRLVLVLFYFSFFKYLILIIGSPVFAYLSEKTEAIIEEKEHSFNWADVKKDCIRSIKLAFAKLWLAICLSYCINSFITDSRYWLDHSCHCFADGMLLLWFFHAGL